MENGERCTLFPMVRMEDGTYSINDGVLRDVWTKLVAEGKDKALFWGGSVQTAAQFIDWLKVPFNYPVLVIDTEQVAFLAWLNNYADKVAMAHFCGVLPLRLEYPKTVMRYWAGMKDADGEPLLRTIIGLIPSVNVKAIRMVEKVEWKVLGEIPDALELYDGSRSGATVTYYSTKDWR